MPNRQFIKLTRSDIEAIDRAILYIRKYFCYNISTESIAEEVGLNVRKLQFGIKKRTSQTIHQFQLTLRIDNSHRELIETKLPIKILASNNGFKNASQFGKIFKTKFGMSPSKYRTQKALSKTT